MHTTEKERSTLHLRPEFIDFLAKGDSPRDLLLIWKPAGDAAQVGGREYIGTIGLPWAKSQNQGGSDSPKSILHDRQS